LAELAASPRVRLANHYGPTEGSIGTTFNWIDDAEQATGVLPIGRPLPNTTAYVLDERARLLPVGVPGELCLGGEQIARGYRGRAGLTAQKFTPDPFGAPGGRLYRTGDLVRHRPDGTLEFLGRIDHQVKIRGHRVELGEIEAVLSRHDGVSGTAVIVREDIPGDRRLVGYVVPSGASLDVAGLRAYVAESLPGFMVPSVIVAVPEIPLLPSRKVDRSRLPAPVITRSDEDYVAPNGPVQEVIAGIWADLLGADRIGATDDFFALGGHSLLVTRVMSRVREAFGVDVPFGAIFDSPTVAGLGAVVSGLMAGGATAELPPVEPAGRDQELPLSYPQQRLWFLDQLIPGNPFYNLPAAYRLQGPLDVEALHRTVTDIVHRHEVLRTIFPAPSGGRPVQVVLPAGEVPMPVVDVPGATVEERLAEATRITSEKAAEVFDLAAGPVFRATLLRLSPTDHVFIMVIHHMVGDGWSSSLLAKELGVLYNAYATGSDEGLPPLPVQYADYALWQRQWLTGEVIDAQLAYWRDKLTGMPPVLELPADRQRPAVSTYEGSTRLFTVPRAAADGLRAVSREHRATLYMVLLAAFKAMLVRYTGQADVVIGAPVANRRSAVLEDLVGFFINTLVLRTDCSGDPSFSELVERVRETTLGAYAHQDLPFERLVTALAPPRDLSRNPLVQVGFQLQNMPLGLLEMQDLQSWFFMTGKLTTHLDVEVYLTEIPVGVEVPDEMAQTLPPGAADDLPGGLYGRIVYSTDLFDESTMDRLIEHFRRVLEVVAAAPATRISAIDMLTDAERRRLTREWSRGPAPLTGAETTVAQMVERRAAAAPDATAVVCGADQVTYAELNERANRLAGYLRSIGAGPEKAVAVLLPRGIDAVVALLACFKSGGAYVPLDPAYPPSRIEFMLADTGAVALLNEDLMDVDLTGFSPADLPPLGGPDSLAYVIYTSGSTGVPKGVEVPHRGLVNLVRYQAELFGIGPDTRSSNAFGPAFDAALSATVLPLTQGGTLHIQPPDTYRYGEELARHIDANKVTALHLPVSVLKSLPEGDLSSLKSIGTGAESVTPQVVRQWADRLRMFNCYGPTETTVVSAMGRCRPEMANGRSIPIGRPVAGTAVYVLDERMRLVPQGVPGELYIGGIGVSRGYRNRPGHTALSFRPDPYGQAPGARLYRTGDLVRYLADGRLEYLSRIDQQVKVRGHRIELGEVEAALARHPDVADAVASVDEGPGGARLVAHVVLRDDAADLAEIRPFLRDALPGYMVPSVIVAIDAVPLLPSGKVDRAGLPPVEGIRPELAAGYVAPEGQVQLALADIWAGTLGLSGVGVNDDFFALGGHSMLIIQIIWQIKQRLGIELSFADIFESPTITDLSARIAELQAEDDDQ
ncbi:MAG: amino acid adenylation domain-containing protein, partial [Actinoplanes sp.]